MRVYFPTLKQVTSFVLSCRALFEQPVERAANSSGGACPIPHTDREYLRAAL